MKLKSLFCIHLSLVLGQM